MLRLVVLISGGGSNLRALLEASDDTQYPARIVAVGADTDAPGLAHAESAGVPTFVTRPRDFSDREAWGTALLNETRRYSPDLVVSAGFMRILPGSVVKALSPYLINTHPSLLPLFPGAHAVRDALEAGVTETGVTTHVIDAGVDTGPVIRQQRVEILPGDTVDTLHERIKSVERPLLVRTVADIADGTINLSALDHPVSAKE